MFTETNVSDSPESLREYSLASDLCNIQEQRADSQVLKYEQVCVPDIRIECNRQ